VRRWLLCVPAVLCMAMPSTAVARAGGLPMPECKIVIVVNLGSHAAPSWVKENGGCKAAGKPVTGRWSWTAKVQDASGATCAVGPTKGSGTSFTLLPSQPFRLSAAFTLVVPKTGKHQGRKVVVRLDKTTGGYDICGLPLKVTSTSDPTLVVCEFAGNSSFDSYSKTLELGSGQCPASFGSCSWNSVKNGDKSSYTLPNAVQVYGGYIKCSNGNEAIPYPIFEFPLPAQCTGLGMPFVSSFSIPYSWGSGNMYWDITMKTLDANGGLVGWAPYQQLGQYAIAGASIPFCGP